MKTIHKQSLLLFTGMAVLLLGLSELAAQAARTVWLSSLDLTKMQQGWGVPQVNRSVTRVPLSVAGKKYDRGVGTHAKSILWVDLQGGVDRFHAEAGLDDDTKGKGSVDFQVYGDGRKLWDSGVMRAGMPARPVDLDLDGVRTLLLLVTDAGDGLDNDHADWVDARFLVNGKGPKALRQPTEKKVILTPKPGPAPRINGPSVYGCRPGHPFIYRIPTTGTRPIRFAAESLPPSLHLDSHRGIITGRAPDKGDYIVRLQATNHWGGAARSLKIVSGDTLALTPPMGFNDWYAYYDHVTDKLMRQAADAMVASGMADVGYAYVDIDDCWMNAPRNRDPLRVGPLRDAEGNIVPNRHFPDMKALTDYIHSKGLKAGIYTSPGPFTCGGFEGSHQHEAQDAAQFAKWGFDFLKYDWCSYDRIVHGDHSLASLQHPYKLMGDILKQQPRDIVFNLCQYGMGKVWEWGAKVGGNSWRTAGDLGMELSRIFEVALANARHRAWSRPGSWNDPDYIQIGYIGNAHTGGKPRPCPLTPNEQYAFMSMWSLMAAPLFYSGDMTHLDPFTLNVLCNPEVIAVDQDPLGRCARVIHLTDDTFLMVKEMADGSKALGLGNRGEWPVQVTASWTQLNVRGRQLIRDLWRQKNLGVFEDAFTASVPRHGVVLVRLWPMD